MTCNLRRFAFAFILLAASAAAPAKAAFIVAGSTAIPTIAIQDITLLPNTPFNDTDSEIVIKGVTGFGLLTLNRDAQNGSTITISSLTGVYNGSNPLLGSYEFGSVDPLTAADFSGEITNVVQNPADPGFATGQPSSFQSGDITFGGNRFGLRFTSGPAAGFVLFSDPFSFSGTLDGLPPSPGTVFTNSGDDVIDIYSETDGRTVVARSSNRRIVVAAVPEPSSMTLLGAGVASLCLYARRRRKPV